MVDFSSFTLIEGRAIYLQIIDHVKRGLVGKTIVPSDEMPSRRVLSVQLGANPNTIQKAYRLLEEEGLLQSHAGAKSYIEASPEKIMALSQELLEGQISSMVSAVAAMGLTKEEGLTLFARLWEENL